MVNLKLHLKPVVAAFLLALAILQPQAAFTQQVLGDQDALDAMLETLSQAEPAQADRLADQIRNEWEKSGSASADFLLDRGKDAMDDGDVFAAIEHFTALVDHAPAFAQGWAERARAYFELELYGPAIGDLEHALALEPRHFDALTGLAVILDSMDKPEDAYEAYLQVEAIHPHQPGLTEALDRLEPMIRGREL